MTDDQLRNVGRSIELDFEEMDDAIANLPRPPKHVQHAAFGPRFIQGGIMGDSSEVVRKRLREHYKRLDKQLLRRF